MKKTLFFSLCFCTYSLFTAYADWNTNLDAETKAIIQEFPEFQTEEYLSSYEIFYKARNALLKDEALHKRMKQATEKDKFLVLQNKELSIIKKRKKNNICEFHAWEISNLLGLSEFFTPSFPMEIENIQVIVQPMTLFIHGTSERYNPPFPLIKKVSVNSYWQAHLGVYLLGFTNLLPRNVGITPSGKICFFDMEESFNYKNKSLRIADRLNSSFVSQSFDWPQYNAPLSKADVQSLQNLMNNLRQFIGKWPIYKQGRSLSIDEDGFFYRLEKVLSFPLQEGYSFQDFYSFIEPVIGPALEEITPFVQEITRHPAGAGSTLLFLHKQKEKYNLSSQQKNILHQWLNAYVTDIVE